jgi:hypothetical protein
VIAGLIWIACYFAVSFGAAAILTRPLQHASRTRRHIDRLAAEAAATETPKED